MSYVFQARPRPDGKWFWVFYVDGGGGFEIDHSIDYASFDLCDLAMRQALRSFPDSRIDAPKPPSVPVPEPTLNLPLEMGDAGPG